MTINLYYTNLNDLCSEFYETYYCFQVTELQNNLHWKEPLEFIWFELHILKSPEDNIAVLCTKNLEELSVKS